MPLHTGKGRSVAEALKRTTDYVKNPEKTQNGDLVTAYQCNPAIVDQEFLFSKRQYAMITGKKPKKNDVIAYHLRQSFKPGEIDPATANRLGYELAMSLTKGRHAFIVSTHVDKAHVHSHIIFNSTSLDNTRKFRNFWGSSKAVRKISDILCLQNGLSVIENAKPSRGSYSTWLDDKKPPTVRGQLEQIIDRTLANGCKHYEGFLAEMKKAGVEVKRGKHLAFRVPGGKRFIRCDSLSEDYKEEAIMERLAGKRVVRKKPVQKKASNSPRLLIDIQSRIQQANSPGFEKWAKHFNLKEMAKTLIYLQENGLMDYDVLNQKCDEATRRFHELGNKSKANSARMKAIAELERQIGTYSKTRDVLVEYRQLPPRKQKKFYEKHQDEIEVCRASKRYFDSLGLTKLPSIKKLKQEYAQLSAENGEIYAEYREARAKMLELLTAQNNVQRILGLDKKTSREVQRSGAER